ncbi:hypothetical protein RND81_05G212800 [Saponaria officinalis]|uniref:Reverse transcriptase zinc-binding domain-containing protein n=1 Tax=Saponaria officinalis TaxID=3572 RepID=A0AAW1L0S5_SAPOF
MMNNLVETRVQQLILSTTRFAVGRLPFKYLGLPLSSRRLKLCQYQPLVDKFTRRIHHWSSIHLSHAGKLRLIDSILYSNLVYWCSIFKLPLGVVHKLESCSRNFYWGDSDLGSGIHWMKWQYFTKLRCEGGVGIKEVLSWNKAFLLKWLWKLVLSPPSLWLAWADAYLLNGESIWNVQTKATSSWVWSDILHVRDDLLLVLRPPSLWLAWADAYLLNGESIWNVQAKATSSWVWSDILHVRDDLLLLCGDPTTAHSLLMGWTVPGINKFRLKAAYDFFRVGAPGAKKIMVLWEPFALPKYSIVGWQVYHAKLATIDNLQKCGFHFANRCYLCYQEEESPIPTSSFNVPS